MKMHWFVWILFGAALLVSLAVLVLVWQVLQGRLPAGFLADVPGSIQKETEQAAATESTPGQPILHTIELTEGTEIRRFQTASMLLAEALTGQGITLAAEDRLVPDRNTPVNGDLRVELRRAAPFSLQTGRQTFSLRSAEETVGKALARAGFAPQNMDYSIPALEDPLPVNGTVRLVRVSEQTVFDQKLLPYQTEYRADNSLDLETSKVLQEGQQGVDVRGERIRSEDGIQTARQKQSEWRAKEPQNRIVGYGTQAVKKVLDAGGQKIEYWMSLQMYATSYSPCRLGKPDYCHYTTGTGAKLQRGVVAVTRADFAAFGGSQVYIPGYGTAVIADIGGGIPGKRWIDLGYSDNDYKAWSSNVTVYFLWPPPAEYQTTSP